MKSSEWPLMLFTLFVQTAVGMFFAYGLVNFFPGAKEAAQESKAVNDRLLLIICAFTAVSVIISFFHLGNFKNAYYALNNITTSWLSREILFVILFSALAAGYTFIYTKNLLPPVQNITGAAALLCGIILLFVMSKIYMIESIPAWNSIFTPLSFSFSALILGCSTFITASFYFMKKNGAEGFSGASFTTVKIIAGIIVLLLLLELAFSLLQIVLYSSGGRALEESYNLIVKDNIIWFIARIIIQSASIFILLYFCSALRKGEILVNHFYLSYLLIWCAEAAGRFLFYAMYAKMGV